jgi:hypothetical protein
MGPFSNPSLGGVVAIAVSRSHLANIFFSPATKLQQSFAKYSHNFY